MTYYADLHIHSPYSGGSSPRMSFKEIEKRAMEKGIAVMGTGDCFHPRWQREIEALQEDLDTGGLYLFYRAVQFIPTVEVSCEYGRKKVHMLILFKDMVQVRRVRERLAKRGDLNSEGRPALAITPADLMDEVKGMFDEVMIIAAHVLTPWNGVMGERNHYESLGEVFEVLPDGLETGLSADKKMVTSMMTLGDTVSAAVVSFSDAHSPENIGREVTEFRGVPGWKSIRDGIIRREVDTIEYPPPLGKYHFSGHRDCGYSVGVDGVPLCPKCHRRITMGVEQRLADLECPQLHFKERYMVPLIKLIELRVDKSMDAEAINDLYAETLKRYKEIDLLVKKDLFRPGIDIKLSGLIQLVRDQQICIVPGYDGKGGELVNTQRLLWEWMNVADNLFQGKQDYKEAWGKAERIQELMQSGAMTVTQEEYEGLLCRGVPEPL